jgi:hypothetical protein
MPRKFQEKLLPRDAFVLGLMGSPGSALFKK